MSITSIVFDVGNVLFGYNPLAIAQKLLPHASNHQDYITHLNLSPIWQALDRGDLDESGAIKQAQANCPTLTTDGLSTIIQDFYLHLDPIEKNHQLFEAIASQLSVTVLSNFQADQFDKLAKLYPFFNKSQGTTISAKINMAKPETAIYNHHIHSFNLNPSTTLFIDDLEENISTAKACGWHGIVYKNHEQLVNELTQMVPELTPVLSSFSTQTLSATKTGNASKAQDSKKTEKVESI